MPTTLREVSSNKLASSRRALVIVGMHRSGTSAMARTLSLLGARLPQQLVKPKPDNPTGFWEPQRIVDLNEEILESVDSDWDDVFAFRPRRYLSKFDQGYLARAIELVQQEFSGAELIILKEPRVSVLAAFWDRALCKAGYSTNYIVMVRNPLEVAESLRDRNGFSREKSFLMWSSYLIAAERDTRNQERVFVTYDQLMSDWRNVLRRIEESASLALPRDTSAAAVEVDVFLNRGMRHHQADAADVLSRSDVPDYVRTLYRIFLDASRGADIDGAAIDAVQEQLEDIESVVGPLLADMRGRARALTRHVDYLNEVHAGKVRSLLQQLESERTERSALDAQLAELESIRGDLVLRESELRQRQEEISQAWQQISVEQATNAALAKELEAKITQVAELDEKLRGADKWIYKLAGERRQAEKLVQSLEDKLAKERKLRETAQSRERQQLAVTRQLLRDRELELTKHAAELESLTQRLTAAGSEFERVSQEFKVESAAKEAAEVRLGEQFREIATLTSLLLEREASESRFKEEADWLRRAATVLLNDAKTRKGWIFQFVPAAFHFKRQRRLLKKNGLFDEEAYLAAHPDVAAEAADPLRHYLKHGIREHRRLG